MGMSSNKEMLLFIFGYRLIKKYLSLYADEEYANQCEDVRLAGTGLDIAYYTVNGKWKGVNRAVAYKTWKWDDTLKDLKMVEDTVQGLVSKSGKRQFVCSSTV